MLFLRFVNSSDILKIFLGFSPGIIPDRVCFWRWNIIGKNITLEVNLLLILA
jgi:hypothetical protein